MTGPARLTHHQESSLVTGNNGRPDQGIITWEVSKPVREVKKPQQRSKELHAFRIFLSHAEAWGWFTKLLLQATRPKQMRAALLPSGSSEEA